MEGNITRSERERWWERRVVRRNVVRIFWRAVRVLGGIVRVEVQNAEGKTRNMGLAG